MPKKKSMRIRAATAADAEIAMRLYDLRREPEMRKARNYINFEFWPQTFDDFNAVAMAYGTPENAYLRQASSYWEMAASLAVRGVLHPGVFLDWCGEAFFVYAKFKPLLKEIREKHGPSAMANIEALATRYPDMRARVKMVEQRLTQRFSQSAQAAEKK